MEIRAEHCATQSIPPGSGSNLACPFLKAQRNNYIARLPRSPDNPTPHASILQPKWPDMEIWIISRPHMRLIAICVQISVFVWVDRTSALTGNQSDQSRAKTFSFDWHFTCLTSLTESRWITHKAAQIQHMSSKFTSVWIYKSEIRFAFLQNDSTLKRSGVPHPPLQGQ